MENKTKDPTAEFSDAMAEETLKIVYGYFAKYTKDKLMLRRLAASYLSYLIEQMILDAFSDYDKKASKANQYKEVHKNFNDIKQEVQLQVANGFNRAMLTYAGQDLDYFCVVKLAPEVNTKNRRLQ